MPAVVSSSAPRSARQMNDATKAPSTTTLRAMCARPTRSGGRVTGDPEQVEEAEHRGQGRTDDADGEEPVRATGEGVAVVGGAGEDVEHDAGDPGTDRHGHEDGVEGCP